MVVTSVVTYTFPIGPFLGAPAARYGPSVDWGVRILRMSLNPRTHRCRYTLHSWSLVRHRALANELIYMLRLTKDSVKSLKY